MFNIIRHFYQIVNGDFVQIYFTYALDFCGITYAMKK